MSDMITGSDPISDGFEHVLIERLKSASVPNGVAGTIGLNVVDGAGWTYRIGDHGVALSAGVADDADTVISADTATLGGVLDGSASPIEAFIDGKLQVRGNLALSLRLGTVFDAPHRDIAVRAHDTYVNGIKTFYLEAGRGDPVILLHGLGATNASFLTTLWDLARDHRVIAPDLPGFGDSGKPIRSYNAHFYSRWLIGLLDRLGIQRAHMIGNSMGGRIAIEVALVAPERVQRNVLLAPAPAFIKYREWTRVVRVLRPELALVPVPIPRAMVVRELRRMFARPERLPRPWYDAAADEFLRVFGTARGRIGFFSAARQIYLEEPYGDSGFWDRLRNLKRDSLFVWGSSDRLVPASFARHVERALPAADSVVLDDCGHVPQYEHPGKTHELVREYLAA